MGHDQIWYSRPRKFGPGSRQCRTCGNHHGLIRKYGLNMCRQCFRQYAGDIGFVKVSFNFISSSFYLFRSLQSQIYPSSTTPTTTTWTPNINIPWKKKISSTPISIQSSFISYSSFLFHDFHFISLFISYSLFISLWFFFYFYFESNTNFYFFYFSFYLFRTVKCIANSFQLYQYK